ncbi:nickel ABC transporter permease subunit NikB, partial [Peribacillus frigoritolerans]|nr:nickel ABC transporter permease subunit NikB [Peribacillus frigoritolerans]
MFRILVRRFIEVAIFVLVITFISFLFVRLAPGDPVLSILQVDDVSVTNEQVNELREELGFNDPLFVQYGNWFADFIRL